MAAIAAVNAQAIRPERHPSYASLMGTVSTEAAVSPIASAVE